jgi:hypothetical protein
MKTIDTRGLKAKHRLELVMQELGEQFRMQGDQWHSQNTPGLIVYIRRQNYEYQRPGMDKETGDLLTWLKRRFNWSFKQTIAYLQKRDPDPQSDEHPEPIQHKDKQPVETFQGKSSKSEFPDEEKESSESYESGVGYLNGKTYYYYLLKPIDHLQERALEIGGEKMRDYFTWKADDLWLERNQQPSRFLPVQDMDISICDECEKPIEWWWKQMPHYGYREKFTPGSVGIAWERVRVIDEPQVYAFEYEQFEETFWVCENCKRKMINYREALDLLYRSARKHEREALRNEEHEIAHQV